MVFIPAPNFHSAGAAPAVKEHKKMRKRTLIIICLPVILILILLGTGLPQQFFPAVRVGNASYTIADYNFYYFESYYSYVTDHSEELESVGLDVSRKLKTQHYDENTTWAQYFRTQTLTDLQEYEILCAAAQAVGFDAAEAVAETANQKALELREYCIANGIKEIETYLKAMYDAGITEEEYYEMLNHRTLAECYRAVLLEELAPSDSEVRSYQAEQFSSQSGSGYSTANVVIAYFAVANDRVTGVPEERQWSNAAAKAEAARDWANDHGGSAAAFADMAAAYSELDAPDHPDGVYLNLTRDQLVDQPLLDWIYDSARTTGDTAVLRGSTGCYLVYFNGWGEDSLTVQAREALLARNYEAWLDARRAAFPVTTNPVSMLIAR